MHKAHRRWNSPKIGDPHLAIALSQTPYFGKALTLGLYLIHGIFSLLLSTPQHCCFLGGIHAVLVDG